jgi:hypothetical protein
MRFETSAMRHVIDEEPTFTEFFVTCLLKRNSRVEADLVDQLFNSSSQPLGDTATVERKISAAGATRHSSFPSDSRKLLKVME